MFNNKRITDITFQDVEFLVEHQKEGPHLDYKATPTTDIAKYVSGFANSSGGWLVIGVDEDKINRKFGITGIPIREGKQNRDEWISTILTGKIEPKVNYEIQLIPIPNIPDKCIIVIYVPESKKKPHMLTDGFNYHVRHHDKTQPAGHYEVEKMFKGADKIKEEFQAFLKKRNLFDEDDNNFGLNIYSQKISNSYIPAHEKIPFVLYSLIPVDPEEKIIKAPFTELLQWLNQNYCIGQTYVYMPSNHYEDGVKKDGVTIQYESDNKKLSAYFDILSNGFVESGMSESIVYYGAKNKKMIGATQIPGYSMALISWAQKFYEFVRYSGDIHMQISFINVKDAELTEFHRRNERYRPGSEPTNKDHQNFKITRKLSVKELSKEDIVKIGKEISEEVHNAFGVTNENCFWGEDLDPMIMGRFRWHS